MTAKLLVERWSSSRQEWRAYGTIALEVPFANTRSFNFCMELTALLNDIMCKNAWQMGRYRLGSDDEATLEWDGITARMSQPARTVRSTVEEVLAEVEAEEIEGQERKSRN